MWVKCVQTTTAIAKRLKSVARTKGQKVDEANWMYESVPVLRLHVRGEVTYVTQLAPSKMCCNLCPVPYLWLATWEMTAEVIVLGTAQNHSSVTLGLEKSAVCLVWGGCNRFSSVGPSLGQRYYDGFCGGRWRVCPFLNVRSMLLSFAAFCWGLILAPHNF